MRPPAKLLPFRVFIKLTCLCLAMGLLAPAAAQETPVDSSGFYFKLRKSFYKRKFTRFIYKMVFVDPLTPKYKPKVLSAKQTESDPDKNFEGRIIRRIIVKVWDPFGHAVADTILRPINGLQKFGNRFHITTKPWIIRNLMLLEPGDTVSQLRLNESERLLRATRYINDASVRIVEIPGNDSVDVKVVVLDKWSFDPNIAFGPNGGFLRLKDRNVGGLGQTYEQRLGWYRESGYDYRGNFHINNFMRTFIASDLYYTTTQDLTMMGMALNRPFYSPLTRWAGGFQAEKHWGIFKVIDSADMEIGSRYEKTYVDAWSGIAFAPGFFAKNERSNTKIVLAGRVSELHYQLRPLESLDTARTHAGMTQYLGSVGFSQRKYYRDQYIYRFGATEDVPEGILIRAVYGLVDMEHQGLFRYRGLEASSGRHLNYVGYLSATGALGNIYNAGKKGSYTLQTGVYFFSDLIFAGRWYFRQFVNYKYVLGLYKRYNERITLHSHEMYGLQAGDLRGTCKMLLNLETVGYAPWSFIGFKMAPLLRLGFGILENSPNQLLHGKVYQAYSLGMMFRNENLLNSSFEITGGYYPFLPDGRRDVFRLNPVLTFSLKVRSFEIGRPDMLVYE